MQLTDRRHSQLTILAWGVIYGLLLVRDLPAELQRGSSAILLVLADVFVALSAVFVTVLVVAIPLRIIMNLVDKDRRQSHRAETNALTLLLIFVAGYAFEVRRERHSLSPPHNVESLSAFAKAMRPPRSLQLVQNSSRNYIAWTGDLSGPLDVPSGPACYIFNDNGDLVVWQPETGDGGPAEDFLRLSVIQRPLSLDDALKITGTTAAGQNNDAGDRGF